MAVRPPSTCNDPHAFSFPHAALPSSPMKPISARISILPFVTLTTTGFGDMVPLEPYSRSLTTLIAITGQMYVAIIISILVGKYATSGKGGKERGISGQKPGIPFSADHLPPASSQSFTYSTQTSSLSKRLCCRRIGNDHIGAYAYVVDRVFGKPAGATHGIPECILPEGKSTSTALE